MNEHPSGERVLSGGEVRRLPLVAIGGTAQGLSDVTELLARLPHDAGLAYIVILQAAPDDERHLAQLIGAQLNMPVYDITGSVALEPNGVFVLPASASVEAIDTHLRLAEPAASPDDPRGSIDRLFATLSRTHDAAIAILLGGSGTDGVLGLEQIRERGGLTIARDPGETEIDGRSRSAIAAAAVDLVLPIAEIPAAVIRFAQTWPRLELPRDDQETTAETQHFLLQIFSLIHARLGRDFRHYKPSTMLRRVSRRMQANQIRDPQAYLALIRDGPEEVTALAEDLLVTVTNFFRDEAVFATLEDRVISSLFDGKGLGDSIRAWSVGCATGEEAYSLAMLLLEEAARRETPPAIQVFASDLHQGALAKARASVYPATIAAHVGPERLARFFEQDGGGYRIRKEVRDLIIFAPHNVLADPPFSRIDLIACRNLLIYLSRTLHPQVVELFHYALRDEGVLVLGTSENIDGPELFRVEDKKHSIYRRRRVPGPELRLPVVPLAQGRTPSSLPTHAGPAKAPLGYGALHLHLVEQHGPPSVLLNPDHDVVHSSAHAGRYLVHPGGLPTANIFKLVREELRIELRAALAVARNERRSVRTRPVSVRCEGEPVEVSLDVRPALSPEQDGFLLLLFDERPEQEGSQPDAPRSGQGSSVANDHQLSRIRQLDAEKQLAEQRLQQLIEEYETSQEELKASNEELQSANEELRSTLEELETSKEELQSMNEELQTVNQENRHKVEELDRLSSDLQNLLIATDIATLFLDRDNRILRFTPKIERLFNIRVADRGRALSDFTSRLGYDALAHDARDVLDKLVPVEREVRDEAGCWYLTRILPYRDFQDRIAGVVVTFVDITGLKQAQEDVRRAKETSETIIESLPEPLLVLTGDLRVHSANTAFFQRFHVARSDTLNRKLFELGNGQWNIPQLRTLLEQVLPDAQEFAGYHVDHEFEQLGRRVMLLSGRRLDSLDLILLGIHDVTEQHDSEQALKQSEQRFRALVTASSEVLYRMSPDWTEMRRLDSRGFLASTEEPTRGWIEDYIPPEAQPRIQLAIEHAIATKGVFELEHRVRCADGGVGWTISRAIPMLDTAGEIVEWFGAAHDVTERREAEEALKEADRRKDEYLAMLGHELRNPLSAIRSGAELLKSVGLDDPRLRHATEILHRQSTHMSSIIDGLLDVSRIARGKIHLDRKPLDLREVIEGVLEVGRPRIDELGLEVELATEPLWVMGDEARLAQVFDNIVGNAIKFTRPPGTVTVIAQRVDEHAVVRVRDTGIGIRREILSSIFESFQQETQDVARASGGLGLGLSLAQGLVELHGGTISAFSAGLGTGAEFVVHLPLCSAPHDAEPDEQVEDRTPLRILVVEDHVDAARMLRALLEMAGHRVALAGTGRAALDTLDAQTFDVVLCDLGLPGMSGLELARAVRADETRRELPLVALTGYGQTSDRDHSIDAGFDAHLTKPVGITELEAVLQRLRQT